jgi:hypothetical protein
VNPPDLTREIGDQAYFFACGFASPAQLTARITGPGVAFDLEVLDVGLLPNRDLLANSSSAQKVIPWYPICDLAEGPYTITLNDGVGQPSLLTLDLIKPGIPKIMVRPQTVRRNEPFDIFYCGYSDVPNKAIQFDLFSLTGVMPDDKRVFAHLRSWSVFISGDGWAKQEQSTPLDTPENTYYIQDNDGALDGEDLFWVIP